MSVVSQITSFASRIAAEFNAVRALLIPYDDTTPPTTGQTLEFDGTNFVPVSGSQMILKQSTDLLCVGITPSDSSDLAFTIPAGASWAFTIDGIVFSPFNNALFVGCFVTGTATAQFALASVNAPEFENDYVLLSSSGYGRIIQMTGIAEGGASGGTVFIRARKNTTSGSDGEIRKGTTMIVYT